MTQVWPLTDDGLGNRSYVAEVADGLALAVDPGRDPRPYLDLAAAHGLRITFTADTHVHADYIAGSRELAAAGARLLAPAGSGLTFPHEELRDGEDLDLGGLTLRALATPGHTPEHLSYLLLDGARPVAVFTGGALIVGGVSRTDLADLAGAEDWTRAAYRSAQALLGLPGGLAAYPTHGPGSFCSAGETGEHLTTIGQEKAGNPLLAGASEDAFTRHVLARLGSYPAYFARMPAINRRAAPRHATRRPVLAALTPAHVAELTEACLKVGHDNLAGELDGGIEAWQEAGLATASLPLIEVEGDRMPNGSRVLDVRQHGEWASRHLPSAVHAELGTLSDARTVAGMPDGAVAVMCEHGERAMTGASLLAAARGSSSGLWVLRGGPGDWAKATGHALEQE